MPLEDFELKQSLGQGSFGQVCKCIRISDRQVYAMKQIKIQKMREKEKKNALNQIRFLASIQSPFVVGYKEAFYDQVTEKLYIIMELANQGDLQGRIKKAITTKTRIPEEQIWKLAYNVLEGLNKLHQANIIHRDIKPANIFYHDGIAKIGDLNVAKHMVDRFTATQTGTPYYTAPEIWNQQPYNFKCDIWSLGCALYEMAMLRPPFRAETIQRLCKRIMFGEYQKIGSPYSKQLSNFIAKLMTHSHKKRPELKQLLCYPKMMDMKEDFEKKQKIPDRLLKTIKFPNNIMRLNENLPKPRYLSRCKTTKQLPLDQSLAPTPKTSVKLPPPSLKLITSQKNLLLPPIDRQVPGKQISIAKKPRILHRYQSQKLII